MSKLEGLLVTATGTDTGSLHKGFKRLVTFQSRYIADRIFNKGMVETLSSWRESIPYGVIRFDRDKSYLKSSDGSLHIRSGILCWNALSNIELCYRTGWCCCGHDC